MQRDKELNRELKRAESQSTGARADSTQESTVKGDPFTSSAKRQVAAPSSMGMGKDRIASDHRSDCLIDNSNARLDHHGDRMDEHGGMRPNTELDNGNVLTTDKKFKVNPISSVR